MIQRSLRPLLGLLLAGAPVPVLAASERPLAEGWHFVKSDAAGAEAPAFDDRAWQSVSVPHTYNAQDSGIGGAKARGEPEGVYYRGPAWYRLGFAASPQAGKRYLLNFGGVSLKAEVWLNGRRLGQHKGGYGAFRFDATEALRSGDNVLAVRVDNARDTQIAPLNGDFNVFGGLARAVGLIEEDALAFDRLDHAGPGVQVRTTSLKGREAAVALTAALSNARASAARFSLDTRVLDAAGKVVARASRTVMLGAGEKTSIEQSLALHNARLWQGVKAPYLYRVVTEIAESGRVIDSASVPLGVRTVAVRKDGTFLLNGAPYPLHGVNLQLPTRFGRGPVVTDAEIDEDLGLFAEMGATGLRLAHMQHPSRVYERADELGLLVLTEVPLIDDHDPSDAFRENLVEQMRELIAQTGNHPSVALWGIGNEIRKSDAASNRILSELQATARALDPTRPTTYAHCCLDDSDPIAQHSDTVSYNRYFGWYWTNSEDIGPWADALHAKMPGRPFGVSEYGAGASVLHQEDPVMKRPESNGYWHPEQYQTDFHIKHWREMKKRPFLWSSFVWVGIDYPSFKRNEGDRPAINDKGLVTEDRKTRKDAWYWYQANWSDTPMLHLASRRDVNKRTQRVVAQAFTNRPEVEMRLNGGAWTKVPVDDHIAAWTVDLAPGSNRVEARAGTLIDTVTWNWTTRP
ncbi:beta-galactosidase [Novosphingobium sp. PhB55]|uniref:glycoside hydrolase family 2 protein n=1 Tax=unclassified Novosphingobium TaxID=2644732 RepID=UPI0010663279|nr:glycoside hydrolase family 2 TIM barrel-domain containing protein [Novosphingobium sp. PhB55]TDW64341.1 beta-galactosidase [Novosphingobium sp. PhB55]